jgi:hypothetical protein
MLGGGGVSSRRKCFRMAEAVKPSIDVKMTEPGN